MRGKCQKQFAVPKLLRSEYSFDLSLWKYWPWTVSKCFCKTKPTGHHLQHLVQWVDLRSSSLISAKPATCFKKHLSEPRTCWRRRSNLRKAEGFHQCRKCFPRHVEVDVSFPGTRESGIGQDY